MRESEVIVEMTIISQLHDTPRSKECRGILEEHEAGCAGVSEESCDALRDRYLDRCMNYSTAAQANVTAVWKGQIHQGENLVNFEPGGFWRMTITGGSCIGPIKLLPGDQLVFCGYLDSSGELVGRECSSSPAHEPYREKWHALREAAAAQPENLNAQIALAAFLEEWNDRTGALAAYDRIRRLSPNDPRSFVGPGRIEFRDQQNKEHVAPRYDEAILLFQQALDLDPTNIESLNYLNRIYFLQGKQADLSLVDFQGLELIGRDLSNNNLRGKDFSETIFIHVSLANSILDDANFSNSSLQNVDLSNASLRRADFSVNNNARLSNIYSTNLEMHLFADADLTGAKFANRMLVLDLTSRNSISNWAVANLRDATLYCSVYPWSYEDIIEPAKQWSILLENLLELRQLKRAQPDIQLVEDCHRTIDYYLSLPADCQPWLPAEKRSSNCSFMR